MTTTNGFVSSSFPQRWCTLTTTTTTTVTRTTRTRVPLITLLVLIVCSHTTRGATDETKTTTTTSPTNPNSASPKCGIYLAPSSIPGAGLGMYAGDVTFATGDLVTPGDIVIPLSEYEWNNKGGPFADHIWMPNEYTWNGPVFPDMDEEADDPDEIMCMSPGVGAAANSYLTLVNIDYSETKTSRPVPPQSPGTGASTLYDSREYYATKTIPPGGEIFVEYVCFFGLFSF
jgi:hypothetical protein